MEKYKTCICKQADHGCITIEHRNSDGGFAGLQHCHLCNNPSQYLYLLDAENCISICKLCLLKMVDELNKTTLADCRNEFKLYPER